MKKIPTIFKRDPNDMSKILNEHHSACEWVFNGEGVATRKYDGTSCLIENGVLYKRREIKIGGNVPANFVQADHDEVTGKIVGWVPVESNNKEDRWHLSAFKQGMPDGTYELLGEKVQKNPEAFKEHALLKHSDAEQFLNIPRDYAGLREWLRDKDIEGLVFHHVDGRMAKIKKRDFGLKRK